jgi:pimeloyl-ACP methyl ester carboxylesterase
MDAEGLQKAMSSGSAWDGMVVLELAVRAPEWLAGLILVASAGAGHSGEEEIKSISCLTLVVWGEDNSVIPLADAARFSAAIADSREEAIPDVTAEDGMPVWSRHHPMRFKPEAFNRITARLLSGL